MEDYAEINLANNRCSIGYITLCILLAGEHC